MYVACVVNEYLPYNWVILKGCLTTLLEILPGHYPQWTLWNNNFTQDTFGWKWYATTVYMGELPPECLSPQFSSLPDYKFPTIILNSSMSWPGTCYQIVHQHITFYQSDTIYIIALYYELPVLYIYIHPSVNKY